MYSGLAYLALVTAFTRSCKRLVQLSHLDDKASITSYLYFGAKTSQILAVLKASHVGSRIIERG